MIGPSRAGAAGGSGSVNEQHGAITGIDVWHPLDPTAEYELRLAHAKAVHVCVQGWVCEAHPDQGFPHHTFTGAECGGARLACPFHGCPRSGRAASA